MKVFKDEKDEQFPIVMNLENGTGRHCLTTNAALELIKKLSELVEEKLKSTNTTKAKIKPCENDNCDDFSEDYEYNCCFFMNCPERV